MMDGERLVFRVHAIQRMFEREISKDDVRKVLKAGTTIESYPDDEPYPSRLILGWSGARPIHVVAAENRDQDEVIIITAYEPDPGRWEPGFSERRR